MSTYQGKRVFITGGSSGIGRSTAMTLVRDGAHVCIGARGKKRLDATLSELKAAASVTGQKIGAVTIDIADKDSVKEAAANVLEILGGIDVLINNAGIAHCNRVTATETSDYEEMMRVNYFGTVYVTQAFLPQMIAQKSGAIANVSSLSGIIGIYGYTAYTPSKFAVVGYSECLRQELLEHKISVSVVYPADTDTPQLEQENVTKPQETKAIAGKVTLMSPNAVAKIMLEGIAAKKFTIVPGSSTKFVRFMYRHFPWMVRWMLDGDVKKSQRKSGATTAA